jgi:hypothetical protein
VKLTDIFPFEGRCCVEPDVPATLPETPLIDAGVAFTLGERPAGAEQSQLTENKQREKATRMIE